LKIAKTAMWALLAMLIALASLSSRVNGITGNYNEDSTPYVGVVVLFSDEARNIPIGFCSGVLISPTVMLTAGHSTFEAAAVSVCFDKGPIDYSIQDGKIVYPNNEIIYHGKPITYPEYSSSVIAGLTQGNHVYSSSDIGLIILDPPVEEVTEFPTLPQPGFADTLTAKTTIQEVGYGVQLQVTPRNNGVLNSWVGTLSCNSAQTQIVSGNFAGSDKYLQLTANPSQGKGGVAFGDSGGPVIYNSGNQDIILAINAYVNSANCVGVTYHTRIDSQQMLEWINGYLSLIKDGNKN
jgi:Trypsin